MRLRRGGLRPPPRESSDELPRTFVGGVGYSHLRDYSVGPIVVERLERRARAEGWPDDIEVGDLSYDPVKIVHWLDAEDPPFDRLILVSAAARGREPGDVTAYRWDQTLPDSEQVQARVAEAVTGVIDVDNLLVVVAALGTPPADIYVVEVEPALEAMGDELTAAVARGARQAEEVAQRIAMTARSEDMAPTCPLGGFGSVN